MFKKKYLSTVVFLFLSCGENKQAIVTEQTQPTLAVPKIVKLSPENTATSIVRDIILQVSFNQAMDDSSLSLNNQKYLFFKLPKWTVLCICQLDTF